MLGISEKFVGAVSLAVLALAAGPALAQSAIERHMQRQGVENEGSPHLIGPDATVIRVCNRTRQPVAAAVSYYDDGYHARTPNWTSVGWFAVEAGDCYPIEMPKDYQGFYYEGPAYLLVVSASQEWGPDNASFCYTEEHSFYHRNSDQMPCDQPDQFTAGGNRIVLSEGQKYITNISN